MAKQKVLILGGGFAGVKAALELCHEPQLEVTLVSEDDIFRYYPALYHSATGGARRVSAIPLNQLLSNHPIKFIKARATSLDREAQTVSTKGAGKLPYDQLIVALGMTTNYFGIKGLQELSYGIKSIQEVERFKNHLHEQLTSEHRPDSHYLVIGGGPTGVELAGMLPSYLRRIAKNHGIDHSAIKVELIEAAPRILPRSPRDVSRAPRRSAGAAPGRLRRGGGQRAT